MFRVLPLSVAAVTACMALAGCDLLDPDRPIAHADTEVFGNLLEASEVSGEQQAWLAKVQVGVPRALVKAVAEGGHPKPEVEEGVVAEVLVTPETVVLAGGRPVALDEISPGTEVVVLPVLGSTRMMGTSVLSVQASYLTDFETYRRWRLPGLARPDDRPPARDDPARINSDGIEHAAVPVRGGTVLYFAARLRPPIRPGEPWQGARREGMRDPGPDGTAVERTYRTELGAEGWSAPRLVVFPGLEDARVVRVSWVSDDETSCLLTVQERDGESWVASAVRPSGGAPWGDVTRQNLREGGGVGDAVYLAGSRTKMVVTVQASPGAPTDLWLSGPSAQTPFMPLQPAINSDAAEWGPRVGPGNELFLNRGDQQLLYAGGKLQALRLPGPQRAVLTEAAPTGDGRWVFFCMPRYVPVELDQDIYVAAWDRGTHLGVPVAADDWRPQAPN